MLIFTTYRFCIMLIVFIKNLKHIIGRAFGVLDQDYVIDMLSDVGREIEDYLDDFYEIRYVLVDGGTGQLESRRLYESHDEALKDTREGRYGEKCLVGMLLVERP